MPWSYRRPPCTRHCFAWGAKGGRKRPRTVLVSLMIWSLPLSLLETAISEPSRPRGTDVSVVYCGSCFSFWAAWPLSSLRETARGLYLLSSSFIGFWSPELQEYRFEYLWLLARASYTDRSGRRTWLISLFRCGWLLGYSCLI